MSEENLRTVRSRLDALQADFEAEFAAMDPADTTARGAAMARQAHETALELIDLITNTGSGL